MEIGQMKNSLPAVDYNALKKKFPPRKDISKRRLSKAAVKSIAREYELKKAQLTGGAPVMKRGMVFYAVVIIGLMIVGGTVLSVCGRGGGRSILRDPNKDVRTSINALAIALGRFKFHTGDYPTDSEGLGALAAKQFLKRGWDGPYINHLVDDPWGHDYVYETCPTGGVPVLFSKGADGLTATPDDVFPDPKLFNQAFDDTSWTNGWAPYRLRGIVVAPDEATKRRVQEEMKRYDR
jgi:general secretion pathway protein G